MPKITTPTGDTFEETNPVALNYYRREDGYDVDDTDPAAFDPAEHSVAEVNDYLEGASEDEQQRVLDAEAAGKARKGILGED